MIFPAIAVAVGTLLALGDASKAETVTKLRAAREKFFKGKDFPAMLANKADGQLRKAAVSPDSTYVSSGWVVNNFYQEETCGSAMFADGFAVNTCFQEDGASYKYQITGDSCTGAVRQEYSDDACATLVATTSLGGTILCVGSGGYSALTTCSTSSDPSVSFSSVITTYYRETGCGSAASFSAVATNTCLGGYTYQCSGSSGTLTAYANEDCTGASDSQSGDFGGCEADDDDTPADDTYYAGDAAESMKMSCTNDAASLMNSLGAKTVLAIVLGAAAYMAL